MGCTNYACAFFNTKIVHFFYTIRRSKISCRIFCTQAQEVRVIIWLKFISYNFPMFCCTEEALRCDHSRCRSAREGKLSPPCWRKLQNAIEKQSQRSHPWVCISSIPHRDMRLKPVSQLNHPGLWTHLSLTLTLQIEVDQTSSLKWGFHRLQNANVIFHEAVN